MYSLLFVTKLNFSGFVLKWPVDKFQKFDLKLNLRYKRLAAITAFKLS